MKNMHTDPRENAPSKNKLTPEDWQRIRERHVEVMTERQMESDRNFLAALQFGQALRQQAQRDEG